jgi:hypothetical protein
MPKARPRQTPAPLLCILLIVLTPRTLPAQNPEASRLSQSAAQKYQAAEASDR